MTAAIPVTRFGGKVFAYNANSIVVSKSTLDNGIKFNSGAKKSDRSCRNGVDNVCDSPQRFKLYSRDLHFHQRDGVVVRASASQSVDLGFIPLVESYQKTLKNGIRSFPAWRSAFRGGCGEQAGKFSCCVLGQGT